MLGERGRGHLQLLLAQVELIEVSLHFDFWGDIVCTTGKEKEPSTHLFIADILTTSGMFEENSQCFTGFYCASLKCQRLGLAPLGDKKVCRTLMLWGTESRSPGPIGKRLTFSLGDSPVCLQLAMAFLSMHFADPFRIISGLSSDDDSLCLMCLVAAGLSGQSPVYMVKRHKRKSGHSEMS